MNARDIELSVANLFGYRSNIIVPNVFWGLGCGYEMDMVIVTQSGYMTEIEIKTSIADLKRDLNKKRFHNFKYVRRFYYAVPHDLIDSQYIHPKAGIISVIETNGQIKAKFIKQSIWNKDADKLPETKIKKLLHLGCMRIWSLKKIIKQKQGNKFQNPELIEPNQ